MIGITGTNGKTTVAYLVNSVLQAANIQSFVLGTLNSKNTDLSTPEAVDIKHCMQKHLQNGGTHFVMEVTSEGIAESRVKDIHFDIKLLTNITRDHLDYHQSLSAYRDTKFKFMRSGDCHKIYPTDFINVELLFPVKLLGQFNTLNMKSAIAILQQIGISESIIKETLSKIEPPPGRLEGLFKGQKFKLFVDFAHTPDALEVVLEALKELALYQKGKLLVLFGCGGNRDAGKRPLMGEVASRQSDFIVLTDDNPRLEESYRIIDEIKSGFQADYDNYVIIQNRKKAIKHIIAQAKDNDVVVLLGKGHETYQIIGKNKTHHDDRETAGIELLNSIKTQQAMI